MKKTIIDLINTFKLSKGLLRDNPRLVDKIEEILSKADDDHPDYSDYLDEDDMGQPDELDFEGQGFSDEDTQMDEDQVGRPAEETEDYGEGFSYFDEDDVPPSDHEIDAQSLQAEAPMAGAEGAEAGIGSDERSFAPEDAEAEIPADNEEGAEEEAPSKAAGSSRFREWQPKESYEDHHQEAIDKYMADGYSHREAEAMAGAHDLPKSIEDAFKSSVKASEPSGKFLSELKELASPWLKGVADAKAKMAKQEQNPELHGYGKILEAKEQAKVHKDALNQFLKSPELEGLSRKERRQAISKWKAEYEEQNPNHRLETMRAVGEAGTAFKEAREVRKRTVQERLADIMDSLKVSPDVETQSGQAAAQHVGGAKEEAGYTSGIEKDPAAVFAEANPEFLEFHQNNVNSKLPPEAMQRMKGLKTAKTPKKEGDE